MNEESFLFFHLRLADLHNKWLISEGSTHTHKKAQKAPTTQKDKFSVVEVDELYRTNFDVLEQPIDDIRSHLGLG